ncbi:MAG: flagella basal body P-ring formation protein FlgA [Rhodobacterales bacterium]|nr:MAG: flagella basal body P-ring formation protein FlgA [Rhodobacterales bacterium]
MKPLLFALFLFSAAAAAADTLVPTHTIRSRSMIGAQDVTLKPIDSPGALTHAQDAIGQEARITLYAGRPIRPQDIGPAAIIERNQIVQLVFQRGELTIITEARSLGRGGVGDVLRVMNLGSRTTVSGKVRPDGSVIVGQ